jgi:hypothetical protein
MTTLKVKKETPLKTTGGVKLKQSKPSFNSLMGDHPAEVADNPLDSLPDTGDLEGNTQAEISAALAFIIAEKKIRRDAYRVMVDHEYWVCVCFQSRDQKEEFLDKAKWRDLGEKYIDGLALAKRMRLDVQPIPLNAKLPPKAPKSLREEVMDDASKCTSTSEP